MQRFLYLLVLFLSLQNLFAQDPVLTQFYASPTLMNPAFAGSDGNTRLGLGYRDQSTRSDRILKTMYIYGDSWIESFNSGLGLSILNQKEELTNYNFLLFSFNYSYHLKISDTWTLFPGFAIDLGYKDYNFGGLLFEDQIDILNGNTSITSDPVLNDRRESVSFFDVSIGGVLYAENAWLGFSLRHLVKPDISFVEGENLPLPIYFSVHGGYQIPLSSDYRRSFFTEESSLYLTFNYMKQGEAYNRLDFGAEMEVGLFSFGFLASSVIQKIVDESETFITFSPVVGLETNDFRVGFSYDFPTSNFSTFGGTSEITLQYFIKNNYSRRSIWQKKH